MTLAPYGKIVLTAGSGILTTANRQTVAAWHVTSTHFGFPSNFAEIYLISSKLNDKDSVRTFHRILSTAINYIHY